MSKDTTTHIDSELAKYLRITESKNDDAIHVELKALERFFEGGPKLNPKKALKLARAMLLETTNDVTINLCRTVLSVKDPVKYLENCYTMIHDFADLKQKNIDEGFHGIIFIANRTWPIKIDTQKHWLTEDKQWAPDDEYSIMMESVTQWMYANNKRVFQGDVVLYPEFGFSGRVRWFKAALSD